MGGPIIMAIIVEATVATAPHFPAAITGGPEAQACMTAALFTLLPFYFFTFQTAFPPYYIYAREGEGATEGVATLIFDGQMARIIFLSSSVSTGGRYFTPFFDLRTYEKGYKSTKNITLCEKLQYL